VLGAFTFLALVLAAIGIYGLIAYSVGQRTHEIGIRIALGANGADVLRMILWEGSRMALIGAAIGLAMALALPKIFEAMFYDLHVGEPRIYVIVARAARIRRSRALSYWVGPGERTAESNPDSRGRPTSRTDLLPELHRAPESGLRSSCTGSGAASLRGFPRSSSFIQPA
jgi:hypothetical protein